MPTKLSSKDVLLYLNELGYSNINAQQLKEFMTDLKKLIKYEEEKKRLEKSSTLTSHLYNSTESTISQPKNDSPDIFTKLYQKGTVESNAKIVQKKENIVSIQIRRSRLNRAENKENIDSDRKTADLRPVSPAKNQIIPEKELQPVPVKEVAEKSTNTKKFKPKPVKKTCAFIRPLIPHTNKCDPVALYHQYKAEWKRVSIPGENNRDELRWAIREKMCSAPR